MKRSYGLQFLFGLFVVLLMMLVKPFDVYAITPIGNMVSDCTYEDGPWSGQRYLISTLDSSGNVLSTKYKLTGWRDGSGLGSAYYQLSFDPYTYDFYTFASSDGSCNNIAIMSEDPLIELCLVDSSGNILANVLNDAFIGEHDGKYMYGATLFYNVGFAFRSSSMVYITELSPAFNGGSYYEAFMDAMPFVGGVYDGSNIGVRYPGMTFESLSSRLLSYGFNYLVFPLVCLPRTRFADMVLNYRFYDSSGVLHSDSTYDFTFKVFNCDYGQVLYSGETPVAGNLSSDVFNVSIEGRDVSLSSLSFGFHGDSDGISDAYAYKYVSSSSDDIGTLPPDDSGEGEDSGSPNYSAALSQIGARLDQVMDAVAQGSQQIVNNITYQTTEITNTITNTVTNMTQQITQGLSDVKQGITDKLQGVQEGISSSIEEANKEQMENDQKLHDEQIAADKQNTDTIVNGFDSGSLDDNGSKLEDSLNGYEEAEKNVIDKVNDSLNDFEFDSGFEEYSNTISTISDFLQALYDSSGGFKVVINLSLMLSLASLVIGFYRFKG